MRLLDSRRLTGPSLLLDEPGAILEVALDGAEPEPAIAAWRAALDRLRGALAWSGAAVARAHRDGLSLAFPAPIDVLYAATEVNEAAWQMAEAALGSEPAPEPLAATVTRLEAAIEEERKPWLQALAAEANRRGVTLLADDKRISVGLGLGSRA